jgi:glucose-6-phosphate 1-dehydrogenase
MREGVEQFGRVHLTTEGWDKFAAGLQYVEYDMNAPDGFDALKQALAKTDKERGTNGNHLLYFSTPPNAVIPLVERLHAAGLTAQPQEPSCA